MSFSHTITVICAYCKKTIETKDGEGFDGISHGICTNCIDTVYHLVLPSDDKPIPPKRVESCIAKAKKK